MTVDQDVSAVTIPYADLRDYTASLFAASGASEADAALMREILASNDLHGSSSHGTACAADPNTGGWQGYVNRMLPGPNQSVNPTPRVRMVLEDGTTAVCVWRGRWDGAYCVQASSRLGNQKGEDPWHSLRDYTQPLPFRRCAQPVICQCLMHTASTNEALVISSRWDSGGHVDTLRSRRELPRNCRLVPPLQQQRPNDFSGPLNSFCQPNFADFNRCTVGGASGPSPRHGSIVWPRS